LSFTSDNDWKYITKFAGNAGKITWFAKARILNADRDSEENISIDHAIYIDNKWDDVRELSTCEQKVNFSPRKSKIEVPLNGTWSSLKLGTIFQGSDTHFWYFAAAVCGADSKIRIEFEINIINSDESLFSSEESGLNWIFPLVLIFYIWSLCDNMIRLFNSFKKRQELESHMIFLNTAIFLQVLGIAIGSLHMILYTYNGYGIGFFYIFYQLLEVFSSTIVFLLLIIISNGWTIKYKELQDLDIYIPVALLLTVINLIHVSIEKGNEESYNSFSNYDGTSGFIFCFFRGILWSWFIYSVTNLSKEVTPRVGEFLLNFGILSSVYFLNLPFVILFSWCFDHYARNKIVILLVNLSQTVVFFYLTHIFGEKSNFYKLSTLSRSTLPGKIQ
jgi:hypothetical protein